LVRSISSRTALLTAAMSTPTCFAMARNQDLGLEVGLEVQLGAHIGPGRLAVLADHDERRQEDGLEADDHGEEPERELVEPRAEPSSPSVEQDPDGEPAEVQVDERHAAGEAGDRIRHPVLVAAQPAEHQALVAGLVRHRHREVRLGQARRRCVTGHARKCARHDPRGGQLRWRP
jgi:hypothetical protein